MKLNEIVRQFTDEYDLNINSETRYIDLVSELGELGKEILKGSNYSKHELKVNENTKEEIGDVLFSLLALFNSLEIDPDEALAIVLKKYKNRFDKKGDIGSGK